MLFENMFPNYYDYKTPMWSTWKEEDGNAILEVVVPGYKKEEFNLFVDEDKALKLTIESTKQQLSYSILSSYYSNKYDFPSANAVYDAGILKITIPKAANKKQKQIPIRVS
jgi:HSP20 family molecular chaperone IbpA